LSIVFVAVTWWSVKNDSIIWERPRRNTLGFLWAEGIISYKVKGCLYKALRSLFGEIQTMNGSKTNLEWPILAGKYIGIFGKGGSGKSTAIVLLARGLRDRGYEVCVLDADSTNVGLARALGIEASPKPLMEYFGGMVFSGGMVTCPVDDPTLLAGSDISLEELPIQYIRKNKAGITLLVAGKIGEQGPGQAAMVLFLRSPGIYG
jgi:hypothetical protein